MAIEDSSVTSGTRHSPEVTIQVTTAGEVNSGLNVGTGVEVFKDKDAAYLRFRTLEAGAGVTITEGEDDITFAVDPATLSLTTDDVTEGTNEYHTDAKVNALITTALDSFNSFDNWQEVNGHLVPTADEQFDIGSSINKVRDIYLSGSTLYFDATAVGIDNGKLTVAGSNLATEAYADAAASAASPTGYNNTAWDLAVSWGDHNTAGYADAVDVYNKTETYTKTEVDGLVTAGVPGGYNNTDWDTAFSWGDHGAEGYLTSFTETDPTVPSHVKSITTTNVSNWNAAHTWGDHSSAGYLTAHQDISGKLDTATFTSTIANYSNTTQMNSAISAATTDMATQTWVGDQNYLTSYTETDPIFSASPAAGIDAADITKWDAAHAWGNHAGAGYLTSYIESDPIFSASPAATVSTAKINNWDSAFAWGNHASAGYITGYTVTSGDVTAHQGDIVIDSTQVSDFAAAVVSNAPAETVTSLSLAANILKYTDEDGVETDLDLSLYLDDTNAARITSGSVDVAGIATFTRDDASTFTVDMSSFLDDTNTTNANLSYIGGSLILQDTATNTVSVDLQTALDGRYLQDYTVTAGDVTAHQGSITILKSQISDFGSYAAAVHNHDDRYYTETEMDVALNAKVDLAGDTMTGALTLSGAPVDANHAATKAYVDAAAAGASPTGYNNTDWDTAFGWGDHSAAGYADDAATTTALDTKWTEDTAKITNWDTAYSWGNHAGAGYADDLATTTAINTKWTQDNTKIGNWDTAYSWGDHSGAGYLVAADITGKADVATTLAGYGITDAYTQGETNALLAGKAAATHTHDIGEVTGLQTELDAKALATSVYTQGEINALLAGKAAATHTHDIGDINTLQATLDAKALAADVYTSVDVDGLIGDGTVDGTAGNTIADRIAAAAPTGYNNTNWDTAYSWGDHGVEGYLVAADIAGKADAATTLAGYGITDAYTTTQIDTLEGTLMPKAGGTFQGDIDMDGNTTTLGGVVEDYTDLGNITGTLTLDPTATTVYAMTLTGDVTFQGFTGAAAGQGVTLIINQDATGSRLWSINGITGKYAMGVTDLSTAAYAIDILHVFYDGVQYYFSFSKGYV